MNHRHIIFVPGKNPKPPVEQHKAVLWRTLLEGVRRADPAIAEDLTQHPERFTLADWNYLYYRESKDISRELPWIDALINQHGATEQDIREANAWHKKFDRNIYNTIDHVPALQVLLTGPMRSTIEETARYFQNHEHIASKVRERLKSKLRPLLESQAKILLIGHSMGSVIAYDTLWTLSQLEHLPGKIDVFLTLGSPLGLKFVRHRLKGHHKPAAEKYPSNIRRWINISAEGDITALNHSFAHDYADMVKYGMVDSIEDHCKGIYNFYRNEEGLNCHRSYGYLVNPAVGKVIADWWQASA